MIKIKWMGAIPKKKKKKQDEGCWGYTFLKIPLEFLDLSLQNSGESFHPLLEILQNCVTPLEYSNIKNQDP